MEVKSGSITLENEEVCLYGIFRGVADISKILVFIPALTGTRIGPQRMFVEISNHVNKCNINTICFDFPYAGDSIDKKDTGFHGLRTYYQYHLSVIYDFLRHKYPESEIIFISISVGCMPVLELSESNHPNRVILLSPNHLEETKSLVNKQNVKAYYQKIFNMETWYKLATLSLNYRKIISNMLPASTGNRHNAPGIPAVPMKKDTHKVNVLCVFGEKDPVLQENLRFWSEHHQKGRFLSYTQAIIKGADHSFMGWNFKKDLTNTISEWLKINQ